MGWNRFLAAAALTIAAPAAADGGTAAGKHSQDCPDCPTMVALPSGTFLMGDDSTEARQDEKPAHQITIRGFAVARTEITRAQFAAFVKDTGYDAAGPCTTDADRDGRWESIAEANWQDPLFPTGDDYPVTCINYHDAKAYADWLSRKTGERYRLLSEAEYEYALRGGTTTAFWWGDSADAMCAHANGPDQSAGKVFARWTRVAQCDDTQPFLAPVASYTPNPFGLYDLAGNAWEWTADCYVPNYTVQPRDGSAFGSEDCGWRSTRGGSWVYGLSDLRSAQRNWKIRPDQRGADVGFRVAREL
jgi:formylglycine-generating enzyme required for sulfatase activity